MINSFALLIPVFFSLVLIEWYISIKKNNKIYKTGTLIMNMSIGAIDQLGALIYFALLYFTLSYVYTNFRVFEIKESWFLWVLAYVVIDFLSYWYHRASHRMNIFWAGHVTHHNADTFNFSNGFRTSLFQGINRIVFWSILPIFGFSPVVLVLTLKVSGLYDFIVHNEYVPRMRLVEKIFITPSLHRVHHGKNDLYIDKNYGSTFSIWDRLFGTYQEETEKVKYGIKADYTDDNPFWAIGHHYYYLWKTMNATPLWSDKIKLLFMPPEWKPRNTTDVAPSFQESKRPATIYLKNYAVFQLSYSAVGIIILLVCQDFFSTPVFVACAFICMVNMAKSAMIFNENVHKDFERRELVWLSCSAILLSIPMFLYSNFYLFYLIIFLLVSLLIIGRMNMNLKYQKGT